MSGYATHIDAKGVYSGNFVGGMFWINPIGDENLQSGIIMGGWYDNGWHGQALSIKIEENAEEFQPGTVFSSTGGVPVFFDTPAYFRNYVHFEDATVSGLNVIAKLG